MNILFFNNNQWLSECCLLCGSLNHIFIDSIEADAWECWSCASRWWIDDVSMDLYIIRMEDNTDEEEAASRLASGHPSIYYLNGQSER